MKAHLTTTSDGTAIYALRGDFDFLVREQFLAEIKASVERLQTRIVLNLRRVTYLTSTGIGSLLAAERLLAAAGGRLVLSEPSEAVRSSLSLVGLTNRLRVCADDTAALASASKGLDGGRRVPSRGVRVDAPGGASNTQ